MKVAKNKGVLGPVVLGISLMAALYSLIVYAGEIESADSATASAMQLDPSITAPASAVSNSMANILNSAIITEMFAKAGVTPQDQAISNHFGAYCTTENKLEDGNCTADSLLMFGDTKLSSITSSAIYDVPTLEAASAFFTNLTMPANGPGVTNFNANVPVNADAVTKDNKLKGAFVQALTDESVLSVIREPFAAMMAKRIALPGGGSEMAKMEGTAMQRFMSPAWVAGVNGKTALQLQQDQVQMQAFQVWMEYQRYRQAERIEALLAVIAMQSSSNSKAAAGAQNAANASQDSLNNLPGSSNSSSSSSSGQ